MKYFKRYYRAIRTQSERRANGTRQEHRKEGYGFARAKRMGKNLPNAWDDVARGYQKSWKVKRKTQWRPEGRGKKHVRHFNGWWPRALWKLTEYLDKHGIAYRNQKINVKRSSRTLVKTKTVQDGFRPYYSHYRVDGVYKLRIAGYWPNYKVVTLDKPYYVECTYYETVGHTLTFWTNKNIGI